MADISLARRLVAAIILCVAIVPTVIFPFIGTVKALAREPYGYPLVKKLVEDVAP